MQAGRAGSHLWRCVMADEREDPGEDVEQETAVPLPERDAMSIVGGPQPLPFDTPDLPEPQPVDGEKPFDLYRI